MTCNSHGETPAIVEFVWGFFWGGLEYNVEGSVGGNGGERGIFADRPLARSHRDEPVSPVPTSRSSERSPTH